MKKRAKKGAIKPFFKEKQETITNFLAISFILLILLAIIFFVNTETYKSIGKASGALGCQEDWICSEWSVCSQEGNQMRYCYDLNNCGTEIDLPRESQECVYIASTMPQMPEEQLAEPIPEPSELPKKNNPWPAVITLLVGIIALGTLGAVNSQKLIKMRNEMQTKQISEETIHELYMYALKRFKQGYEKHHVHQALKQEGWPPHIINKVFTTQVGV